MTMTDTPETPPTAETPATAVITYPRDAILDTAQVCAALGGVSKEIVDKMDLPLFYAGKRPRYLWGMVLDTLAERATPAASEELSFRRKPKKRSGA